MNDSTDVDINLNFSHNWKKLIDRNAILQPDLSSVLTAWSKIFLEKDVLFRQQGVSDYRSFCR